MMLASFLMLTACSSKDAKPTTPVTTQLDETQFNTLLNKQLTRQLNAQEKRLLAQIQAQQSIIEHYQLALINKLNQLPAQTITKGAISNQENRNQDVIPVQLPILGEREHVYIKKLLINVVAQIDSGEQLSTLKVHNIITFKRDKTNWVRFDVQTKGPNTPGQSFEAPIARYQALFTPKPTSNNEIPQGIVIHSQLTLGEYSKSAEILLLNQPSLQSGAGIPLTLGKDFISGFALIDLQKQFILGKSRSL